MHANQVTTETGSADGLAFIYRRWVEPGAAITRDAVENWCKRNRHLLKEHGFTAPSEAVGPLWAALR